MKISVITSSYNQSAFLRQTIESVLSQEWPDVEYIVVEGGSWDDSRQIANEYAEQGRLKLVDYPESRQAQAINRGLALATGDVMAWLNSDDIYLDHAFARVAATFAENTEAGAVYGHELSINATGDVIGIRLAAAGLDAKTALWNGISIPQPAVFFRREVYESVGGLDETFDYALDTEYWNRIVKRFRFKHLPQVLAATRHHKDAKTGLGTGSSCFGKNAKHFYREGARAFLIHGGRKVAPYYLQNRANRYLRNRMAQKVVSRLIGVYGRFTVSK
jgi:glycosyltransferase involved in cell wall biosynthesis